MTTEAELREENLRRQGRCSYCGCFEAFGHSPKCHFYRNWELDEAYKRGNIQVGDASTKPPLQIVTPIPPEVEQYAPEIARFVETMVYKLGVHSKKGKWENLDMRTAISKLNGEVMELEEAIGRGNMIEQMLEAADVANYALIISAKAMERK